MSQPVARIPARERNGQHQAAQRTSSEPADIPQFPLDECRLCGQLTPKAAEHSAMRQLAVAKRRFGSFSTFWRRPRYVCYPSDSVQNFGHYRRESGRRVYLWESAEKYPKRTSRGLLWCAFDGRWVRNSPQTIRHVFNRSRQVQVWSRQG